MSGRKQTWQQQKGKNGTQRANHVQAMRKQEGLGHEGENFNTEIILLRANNSNKLVK